MMKAWIAHWSLLDAHWPMPLVSARPHLAENLTSHVLKSGIPPPAFTALALAIDRQDQYLPAVFSLPDSHLPAAAHALAPSSRTPARAAIAPAIVVVFMVCRPLNVRGRSVP